MKRLIFLSFMAGLTAAACSPSGKPPDASQRVVNPPPAQAEPFTKGGDTMSLKLQSSAFGEGENISKEFTCDGENKSPPLNWSGVPSGTKSIALICDDPDAPSGTWTHWVLWGLPGDATSLAAAVKVDTKLPGDARQGRNSFGEIGYGGPCPPPGNPHRYFFKVYALDGPVNPAGNADQAALENALQGHILAQGQLMGRYGR